MSPLNARLLPAIALLASCAIGCTSLDVSIDVTGDKTGLVRIEITAYGTQATCDEVAFGIVPLENLAPAFISRVDKDADERATLLGLPRLGAKLIVARGVDDAGRILASGCAAIGDLRDNTTIGILLVPQAVVSIDPIDDVNAATLTVHLQDSDGEDIDERRVLWRVFGAAGAPGGAGTHCDVVDVDGCVVSAAGVAEISLPATTASGPIVVQPLVEWSELVPPIARYFVPAASTIWCQRQPISCVAIDALSPDATATQQDLVCISNAPASTSGQLGVYRFNRDTSQFEFALRSDGPSFDNAAAIYQVAPREVVVLDRKLLPNRLRAIRVVLDDADITSETAWDINIGVLDGYTSSAFVSNCGGHAASMVATVLNQATRQITTHVRTLAGATPSWTAQLPADISGVLDGDCLSDYASDARYPAFSAVTDDNAFVAFRVAATQGDGVAEILPLTQSALVDLQLGGGRILEVTINEAGIDVVASRFDQTAGATLVERRLASASAPQTINLADTDGDTQLDWIWPVGLGQDGTRTVIQVTRGVMPSNIVIAALSALLTPNQPTLLEDAKVATGDYDGDGRADTALFNGTAVLLQRAVAGNTVQSGVCF